MAITLAPGQVVGQGDWDALFTQHGGMPQNQQSILRPPTQQEIMAATQGGDDDPAFQQRPIYRYNLADGSYVEARTSKDGAGWEVIAYQPSQKYQQSQAQTTKQTGERIEGTPDPSKPGGFDNERPRMVTRDQSGKEISSRELTPAERKGWMDSREQSRNPGGQTDEEVRAQQQKDDTTATDVSYTGIGKNRVKVTTYKSGRVVKEASPTNATPTGSRYETRNGKQVKIITYDDGTETVDEQQAPKEEILQGRGPNGEDVRVIRDPATGAVVRYEPVQGSTGTPSMPANMPPFQPDVNKPALGLIEYAQRIYALAAQKKPDGTPYLTQQQVKDALATAHQMATSEATRLDNIRASQAQAQTNAVNQRNADLNASVSRGNQANTATADAFKTATAMAGAMTKKNYTPGLMQAILGLQDRRMQQWGGLNNPPPITDQGYPMIQGIGQLGLPSTPAALSELGQPGDPAMAPPTMASPEGQGLMAANEATRQAVEAEQRAATPPPPINPPAGEPGNDPTQPVGMGQGADLMALSSQPMDQPIPTGRPPSDEFGSYNLPNLNTDPGYGQIEYPARGPAAPMPAPGRLPPDAMMRIPWGGAPQPTMQVQHPVIQSVLGQNSDPAWAQAVQEAARQLGLAA